MPRHFFGTDGVRGLANDDLTPDLALSLGRAVVRLAGERGVDRPRVVVGRDTRRSGPMLEDALCAGVASAGGVALRAGVVPTPAVAWLVRDRGADLGAVISASHNPYPDNGIKFFGGDGFKLTDAEEHRVEALLSEAFDPPTGYGVGTSEELADGRRAVHRVRGVGGRPRPAPACASRWTAPTARRRPWPAGCSTASASATTSSARRPNGVNINVRVGSTHLEHVAAKVAAGGYDLGPRLRRRRRPPAVRRCGGQHRRRRPHPRDPGARPAGRRHAARQPGGAHLDGQPRAAARARDDGLLDDRDRRRRPLRAGGDAPRRRRAGRRAVGTRDRAGALHDG